MANNNRNLAKARRNKRDEFLTQMVDVEAELQHYKKHFIGKTVYCNCDDADSNFVKYFQQNDVGIKRLLHTGYSHETKQVDFRSQQSVELLEQADVVVTNPPFSLFREHIGQLIKHDKLFLVLGHQSVVTSHPILQQLVDGRVWLGVNNGGTKWFKVPDWYRIATRERQKTVDGVKYISLGSAYWFTNMTHNYPPAPLKLTAKYSPETYPRYTTTDAINVDRLASIPADYDGLMGVPITIISKHNPSQFTLVGEVRQPATVVENGKKVNKYRRILIKRCD